MRHLHIKICRCLTILKNNHLIRTCQPLLLPQRKLSHAVFLGFSRLLCIARCLCSGVTRFSKGFHSRDQSRTRLLSAFLVRFLGAVRFLVCCLECHQCCFCSLTEGSVKIAFSFFCVRFQNARFDQVPL